MSQVDPADDTKRRFIVWHYRYDPARRERRHVVVAAFDNEREFLACIAKIESEIAVRQEEEKRAATREHASGVVYEAGYFRRAANGHLLSRAIRHGAAGPWVEGLELPSNMAGIRFGRNPG